MKAFSVAARGKGLFKAIKRVGIIISKYGFSTRKMRRNLNKFSFILKENDCPATFPVTGSVVQHHPGIIENYQSDLIEFALHGYYHIDHSLVEFGTEVLQLDAAKELFKKRGIILNGFRFPYLRWNVTTLETLRNSNLIYDSSESLYWDCVDINETPEYQKGIKFYGAKPVSHYPSLPRVEKGFVRIPYSLPDDESLVERLNFNSQSEYPKVWLKILERTHKTGELFTIGLHPERINECEEALLRTIDRAKELLPNIWIASLNDIARWWIDLSNTTVSIEEIGSNRYKLAASNGPKGLTYIARNLLLEPNDQHWESNWVIFNLAKIEIAADQAPFIGISERTSANARSFLQQQGYIIVPDSQFSNLAIHIDQPTFKREDERGLLNWIEQIDSPLIKLGRWPNGFKSALSITGDIDALSGYDYFYRLIDS